MNTSEYLNQLLKDKTTISKMPKIFLHLERLLDEGESPSYLHFIRQHFQIRKPFILYAFCQLRVFLLFRSKESQSQHNGNRLTNEFVECSTLGHPVILNSDLKYFCANAVCLQYGYCSELLIFQCQNCLFLFHNTSAKPTESAISVLIGQEKL